MNQNIKLNLSVSALVQETILQGQGTLSDSGALIVKTGEFTGRSPQDRYIVIDDITRDTVQWNDVNIQISQATYEALKSEIHEYAAMLNQVYVRDTYACASRKYRIDIRVYTEFPWQNLFAYNMFLRPENGSADHADRDEWTIFAFPGVSADPAKHNTRQGNFSIINFSEKTIIIGGTAYTGEIKKGIFSVLNYILPFERNVLSMHCSANVGLKGDTALYFGLSGTGKTTLSNDPNRRLIGDDEHAWSEANVFNLEGGCYAKTIDLSPNKEPQIYKAIRYGALLENIGLKADGHTPDYKDSTITENTRVSYPITHISNIMYNSRGDQPTNIFFLTCDAFGILPPISKLSTEQAMYYFISGYTAKIAGTETGITEPQATFSACFGAPFLPLHPMVYTKLLSDKISSSEKINNRPVNIWLVNTGWTGGPYGEGQRIELSFTRAMIKAALDGKLSKVEYQTEQIFGLSIPKTCPDVPNAILNPRDTWRNEEQYDECADDLVQLFHRNFAQYEEQADESVLMGSPPTVSGI